MYSSQGSLLRARRSLPYTGSARDTSVSETQTALPGAAEMQSQNAEDVHRGPVYSQDPEAA